MMDTGSRYTGVVSVIKIAYENLATSKWWDGTNFTLGSPPTVDTPTLFSSSWTFSGPHTSDLNSGSSYYVTTRALDNGTPSNDEGYFSARSATFTFDNTAPTIVVQAPANNIYFSSVTVLTISGTASDNSSGVQAVQVNIQSGGSYWSGTDNGAGSFGGLNYVTADLSLNPTWQFRIPAAQLSANFVNGQSYTIQARAWDVAGTTSAFTAARTITYDVDYPTGTVTSPGAFMNASQTQIAGTAYDGVSGVSKVEIALSSDSAGGNGTWWNGTSFSVNLSSNTVWQSTTTSSSLGGGTISWAWTRPALQQAKTYSILLRVTDVAGNVTTYPVSARSIFFYDGNPPSVTIQNPSVPYKNSLPIISGQSSDVDTNITGVQVAISTGGPSFTNYYWNGTGWQAGPSVVWLNAAATDLSFNSPSEAWNLTGASTPTWITGITYKIQAQSTDEAANVSSIVSTTFTFDNAFPTLAITNPFDATPQTDTSPRISTTTLYNGLPAIFGTATDTGPSGISVVQLRVRYNDISQWFDPSNGVFHLNDSQAGSAWFNAVTTNNWVNWLSTFTFSTDSRFRVEAQVVTVAGNYSVSYATSSFVMDQNVPQSTLSFPINNSYVRNITAGVNPIFGTYTDNVGGALVNPGTVSTVLFAIQELGPPSNGKWWNSSNVFNQGSPLTNDTASLWASSWTYVNISTSNMTSGTSYYITVRAQDNASPANDEGFYSVRSVTFTYDNVPPAVVVQTPGNGIYFSSASMLMISGTAIDALSGVQAVQVNIQSGGSYWSGTDNGAGSFGGLNYVTADLSLNPTWQFRIPAAQLSANFVHGQSYTIQARAWDVAGTTSAFTAAQTITYDVDYPTAAVTSPVNFINGSQVTITGTAHDAPAGIQSVEVLISSDVAGTNGTWWNGSSFSANFGSAGTFSTTTITVNGGGAGIDSWSFPRPMLELGKTYLVCLRATDHAGNMKLQSIAQGVALTYDDQPPAVTITNPSQAYVRNLTVLSGGSSDATTSILGVDVAISTGSAVPYTDFYWNGVGWQAPIYWFSASAVDGSFNSGNENWNWTGSTPTWINNQIYKIQTRSHDSAANYSSIVGSTFTFDNIPASVRAWSLPQIHRAIKF